MTEHDIQNSIRIALSERGWLVLRINSGKVKMADGRWFDVGVPKGYPDLTAVKNGRVVFLEVKNETGRIRPDQVKFLETIRTRYGCKAGIVRSVEDALELVGEE